MQIVPFELLRSVSVSFPLINTGTGQQIQFPDQPYLRNKKIVSVMCSTSLFDPVSSNQNLFYNFAATGATNPAFLTFYDQNGVQFVQNMPVFDLYVGCFYDSVNLADSLVYNGDGQIQFEPRVIVWPKSYLWFPLGVGFANKSAVFNVYYLND